MNELRGAPESGSDGPGGPTGNGPTGGRHTSSDAGSGYGSLLWFEVSGAPLALPVDQVLEIRPPSRYAAVPGAPREVLGLIQHRGRMIPVMDLAERVGCAGRDAGSGRAAGAVLIVETNERGARRACALAVDRVSGVRERGAGAAAGGIAGAVFDLGAIFGPPPAPPAGAAAPAGRLW
jgi:chemotaxis signal transduction protein